MSMCNQTALGDRDQVIVFFKETTTTDENGDSRVKIVEMNKEFAAVSPVRAGEEERYGGLSDTRVNLFVFPRRAGLIIDASWRIQWNGLEHNIDEIRDPGVPGRDMIVKAISGVAQ